MPDTRFFYRSPAALCQVPGLTAQYLHQRTAHAPLFSIGEVERGEILYRLDARMFRIEKFSGGMLLIFGLLLALD
jgi:hypothetical protein